MSGSPARLVFASGRVVVLDRASGRDGRITVGRHPESDVLLADPTVSRSHATLLWQPSGWVLADTSTHGTRIRTGEQEADLLHGVSRGLRHGDFLWFGETHARFEHLTTDAESDAGQGETPALAPPVHVSRKELAVLTEFSSPLATGGPPASSKAIARALGRSEATVRTHMQSLYRRFGLTQYDKPHMTDGQRRFALANQAYRATLSDPPGGS